MTQLRRGNKTSYIFNSALFTTQTQQIKLNLMNKLTTFDPHCLPDQQIDEGFGNKRVSRCEMMEGVTGIWDQ
jgi:hypothetical protein